MIITFIIFHFWWTNDCKFCQNCTICKYREYVENGGEEINTCSICSQDLTTSETIRLPCLCLHHKNCLVQHFESSSNDKVCPKCQSQIFTEEILKELHETIKLEIVELFKGKEYATIITPNEIKKEEIDSTTQMLLDNNTVKLNENEGKNDEETVAYIQGEMTSLKRKEEIKEDVHIEVGPTIEFDVTSDDDEIDHGMKKKIQNSSIGEDFIKSLQTKGKISGKTILLLFFLMIILVILMIIIFATGNKDT